MSMYTADTIVAIATPPGAGAIGVIRISGPAAFGIVQAAWKGKNLLEAASHTLHLGTICNAAGEPVDEVLAALFRAPRSYTKEDTIELSCHGSAYILQQVTERLLQLGARAAEPGEFTQRAFLNGRFDLSQAEAVADLIASSSQQSHRIAMQQMRGGVSNDIKALREELLHFASLIELELDFGEEDVQFASREDLLRLIDRIDTHIRRLIQSFKLGNAIKHGVPTAIVGKPNAGKSTLLNALLNEEKAIVSDIAGTTRDVVEDVLNIGGVQFRLMDTAGLRDTADSIEAIGVQRTYERMRGSSIILYVFDAGSESLEEAGAVYRQYLAEYPLAEILCIANKSDLLPAGLHEAPFPVLWVSAREKNGIDEVRTRLSEAAGAGSFSESDVIISNLRHVQALDRSADFLQRARTGIQNGLSGDLVAMDIRTALRYLGEITGHVDVEELLGNIFSKFCIGK